MDTRDYTKLHITLIKNLLFFIKCDERRNYDTSHKVVIQATSLNYHSDSSFPQSILHEKEDKVITKGTNGDGNNNNNNNKNNKLSRKQWKTKVQTRVRIRNGDGRFATWETWCTQMTKSSPPAREEFSQRVTTWQWEEEEEKKKEGWSSSSGFSRSFSPFARCSRLGTARVRISLWHYFNYWSSTSSPYTSLFL